MSWGNVAGASIGVIGGMMSADASSDAARIQADAAKKAADTSLQGTRETNQLMADIYRQQLATGAPQLQGGQLALSALMSGMGLGGARAAPNAGTGFNAPRGTAVQSGAIGQLVDANGNVVNAEGQQVNPLTDYGIRDLNYGATQEQLSAAATPYEGAFTEQFAPSDLTTDPSYKWRLEQGMQRLRAAQAAGGNRYGSQSLKDINDYAQGQASTEYQAAFDRFQKNKSLLYERLSNLAGMGSNAANAAAAAGSTAAGNIGTNTASGLAAYNNYNTNAANALAAGRMGSTNAIVGGLTNGLNNYYTLKYLNPGTGGGSNYNYDAQGMWDKANTYSERAPG